MSDHIPDVTKMIGETPRTNLEAFFPHESMYQVCDADFTRQLERELNAANERIKNLESALSTVENINKVNTYQDLESANERIKRLEEAGDEAIYPLEYAARVRIWTAAKEAKP